MSHIPQHNHVSVFWDFENLAIPTGVRGFDAIRRLKESLQPLKVRSIIAVGNVARLTNDLRRELTEAGVSLLDCVSPKASAADMAIVVEMLKASFLSARRRFRKSHTLSVVGLV
eukprot:jgi/Hompol1/2208/HPOL_002861-RA